MTAFPRAPVVEAFSPGMNADASPVPGGASQIPALSGKRMQLTFTVTGQNLGTGSDQTPFFAANGDQALDATYSLRTPVPADTRFNAAGVATFIAYNPMPLDNVNIVNALNGLVLSTMTISVVRQEPDKTNDVQTQDIIAYQTAQDFQTTRVQIPIDGIVLDGYTFIRIINNSQTPAATYQLTFTFGPRIDRRLEVPRSGPKVLRSPGAR